jgi:hypothetical protein
MTRGGFYVFLFACALSIGAHANKPIWIGQIPVAQNNTYDYKVTIGEAKTYDEAYAKALARAILETSWKVSGVTVKVNDDLSHIESDITQSLETISKEVRLRINKVCEYIERPTGSMQVRVYILWQVPIDGYNAPKFESFNCE